MHVADKTDRPRVCLVTPGYLSSTPRVVREADALSAAGFDVRVAFTQGPLTQLQLWDDDLLASRAWSASVCRWNPARPEAKRRYYWSGVRHRLAQAVPAGGWAVPGVVERAEGRVFPELRAVAASQSAEIFIGHYPIGLAAAAHAAARYGARLGYDVEDLYAETFPVNAAWSKPRARILRIESRYVPRCSHISAVSGPVARAFAEMFPARVPVVVHNCLPWADRARLDGQRLDRVDTSLSLFWFSQTVGLDRGLQDAILAMGTAGVPIDLHLRGHAPPDVRRALSEIALGAGVQSRLHFQPPCRPDELLSRAAEHDVGLALETEDAVNRRLTVTNKLFTYMTAGLALSVTDLPGQRSVMDTCPAAGCVHQRGDVRQMAEHYRAWSRNPDLLAAARNAALEAARVRWNAEREQHGTVVAVTRLVGTARPACGPAA